MTEKAFFRGSRKAKAEWFSNNAEPLDAGEIDHMLSISYGSNGLDILTTGQNLKREATGWIVGVDDFDSMVYHWFIAFKRTQAGNKVIFLGHDGETESKSELKLTLMKSLKTPSDHFYTEASGPMLKLLTRYGVPKVPNSEASFILPGKEIEPVPGDEYAYQRVIGGTLREKVLMGFPEISTVGKISYSS